ncbi:hypothetical protein L598_000900000800 [Mesorhizobium sp. J18]|nr:hypothetical protein L598_000900000800 [Mesorhizobium sp. J18]
MNSFIPAKAGETKALMMTSRTGWSGTGLAFAILSATSM